MVELSSKLNNAASDAGDDGKAEAPLRLKFTRVSMQPEPAPRAATGLRDIGMLIRGNIFLILLIVLLCLGAGGAYLAYSPSRYIATATLLIEPVSSTVPEEFYIQSQTQLMRSDSVVRAVVAQLDLVKAGIAKDDQDLLRDRARAAKRYLTLSLAQYIPALARPERKVDKQQEAIQTLRRNLTISRPAMSPITTISYNSTDAARAADIVSALIDTYRTQRRDGEAVTMQQSVAWLTQRLGELRQQLETAERAVESFRAENNIIGSGSNQSLQAEQRLYELNVQLKAARAAAAAPEPAPQPVGIQYPAAPSTSERDEAARRQAVLEAAFEEATLKVRENKRQEARLRELEASSETYRTLHSRMLLRYEEAVQQTLVPEHDGIQVLIAAQQPQYPSHPRPLLVILFAAAFGIALGIAAAVVREWLALEKAEPAE